MHVTGALHSGRHSGDVAKAVLAAKARVKDPDSARALEADLLEANEYLELNAAMGMAAMLLVGASALFDVLTHISRLPQRQGLASHILRFKQTCGPLSSKRQDA